VRLAAASRTEDSARGFNVIELDKTEEQYKNILIRNFEIKRASIEEKYKEEFPLK